MSIYSRPYTFIAVIFAACIVPLSNGHAELVDTSLDVMTFNIRADFDFGAATSKPNAWISTVAPHRRDLVIDVIEDYGPDILGVQEAFRNQVNDLSAALPGYGFYGVGLNNGATFGEHSGIFFRNDRFTATQQGTFWLSNTPNVVGSVFPGAATIRIASWVQLDDAHTGAPLFVLNTHWDHVSQAAREHGAGLIRSHLDGLPDDLPLVVLGDLNVNEDNAAFDRLTEASTHPGSRDLRDSYREVFPVRGIQEGTFNGFNGASFGARIDHILHSNDYVATAAQIVRTEFDGQFPSDHYPVTATLITALVGDYNADDFVSQADLDLVLLNWGDSVVPAEWIATDQFDGVQVSQNELDGLLLNWGSGTPPNAAIPEPTTMLTFAAVLGTLSTRSRRHIQQ